MNILRRLQQTFQNEYIPGSYSSMLVKRQSESSTCTDADSTMVSDISERGSSCHRKKRSVTFSILSCEYFDCEWYADDFENDAVWYSADTISAFKADTMQAVQTLVFEYDDAENQPAGDREAWIFAVADAFTRCQEINTRQGMEALYRSIPEVLPVYKNHSSFDLAQWSAPKLTGGISRSKHRRKLHATIQKLQMSKLARKDTERLTEDIRHASIQASRSSKLFSGYLGILLQEELSTES